MPDPTAQNPPADPPNTAQEPPADGRGISAAPDSSPAILGRASYCWTTDTDQGLIVTADIWTRIDGGTREVLLVDPAAARVLDAAREWLAARRDLGRPGRMSKGEIDRLTGRLDLAEAALAAAVDAHGTLLDLARKRGEDMAVDHDRSRRREWAAALRYGRQVIGDAELASRPDIALGDLAERVDRGTLTPWADQSDEPAPELGTEEVVWDGWRAVAEPAPESASDGPGWDREVIALMVEQLAAGLSTEQVQADHLRALLADRDRQAQDAGNYRQIVEGAGSAAAGMQAERDAARAELAEMQQRWQRAMADGDDQTVTRLRLHGEIRQLRAELAKATAARCDALCRDVEADRDRWQKRAEWAEDRVDGQAWVDLEAERDRLREQLAAIDEAAKIDGEGFRRLRRERGDAFAKLADSQQDLKRVNEWNVDLQRKLIEADAELAHLRADHLLILKDGVVGYELPDGAVPAPGEVRIVLRGDLGQGGGNDA